jgi:hypothetical protein
MSGNQPATSSREAALRIILGDVSDLLDRAESAAGVLRDAHELIDRDLEQFGQLVTQLISASQENSRENEAVLQGLARMKAQIEGWTPPAQAKAKAEASWKTISTIAVCCSLFSSAMVLGIAAMMAKPTLEQARIGKALTDALPYIDSGTRQKLESAIQKAGR